MCLSKNLYIKQLTTLLDGAIKNEFSNCEIKIPIKFTNSKPKSPKIHYEMMLPFCVYLHLLEISKNYNQSEDSIQQILEGLKKQLWNLKISEIDILDNCVYFKQDTSYLGKLIIPSLMRTTSYPEFITNEFTSSICCFISNTSSCIRTLSILDIYTKMLSLNTDGILFVFKYDLPKQEMKSLIKKCTELNFNENNFDYYFNIDQCMENVKKVLYSSSYYHKNEELLYFDQNSQPKDCRFSFQFFENSNIKGTKMHLNNSILKIVGTMYENFTCTYGEANRNEHVEHVTKEEPCVLNLFCQDDLIFVKQIFHSFIIYCHLVTPKCDRNICLICEACEKLYSKWKLCWVSHGPVMVKGTKLSALSVFEKYQEQIIDSFQAKYQNCDDWLPMVDVIAKSVLRLDVLSTSVQSAVNIDLNTNHGSVESRFILYNYSRITTLLEKFENKVAEKYYAPLPDIETVNFSLLREIEECQILDHLWKLKDILLDFSINAPSEKILLAKQVQPNNLVSYLRQLTKFLSSYYSRKHVLENNLPHLLPKMYCRIYLLRAVKIAMLEIFVRLCVTPVKQM